MSHNYSPTKLIHLSVKETQDYFTELRRDKKSLRKRSFDLDDEFQKILTVVSREIDKLMHLSMEADPLDPKNHEAVVAYSKLVGNLKKQMVEAMADTNPEELKKLAAHDED